MSYEIEIHRIVGWASLARLLRSRRCKTIALPTTLLIVSLSVFAVLFSAARANAQLDEATINGTITDPSERLVPNATVTLTQLQTGLVLKATTDAKGSYVFSPIKIGNYSVSATASGFQTTTQTGLAVHVNERLAVNLALKVGKAQDTVTVTADQTPLLQTEQSSTGQVVTAQAINDLPLNGRNYVFVAQLTAGVQQSNGSRGLGGGDFSANGQRPEENNFILDGVDNNTNAVDFLNGASYVVKPPPDALAEFKVQTGSYDAEFGHSAGAVMNASIKSGTNSIHGNLWEYLRNDVLDAGQEFASSKPKYRQNQFGATIGGPLYKNKLFFFGDSEATRIVYGEPGGPFGGPMTVPTDKMRTGDFSELLDTSLTGSSQPRQLYTPGSGGGPGNEMSCAGQNNVMCSPNPIALKIMQAFPHPNANAVSPGVYKTYNNYNLNKNIVDNTVTWDGRIDWNISSKDQTFVRMSEGLEHVLTPSPLGPVLDGGFYADDGSLLIKGENFVFSETHIFTPTLVNEFRLGENAGHFLVTGPSPNVNQSSVAFGMGGFPGSTPGTGGLPYICPGGISCFGTVFNYPGDEHEGVPQLLDNVTFTRGLHSLRAGFSVSRIGSSVFSPQWGRGNLSYSGQFTSTPGNSNTGYGVADFLADRMSGATVSQGVNGDDRHFNYSAYVQDDWKVSPKLTLNLGLRYEYFQQAYEKNDHQANFVALTQGLGTGTGQYRLPARAKSSPSSTLYPAFLTPAAKDNISIVYDGNRSLSTAQKTNFAPRVGAAYSASNRLVMRVGFGLFFGGVESVGGSPNLVSNYPFNFNDTFPSASCNTVGVPCTDNGVTLEGGFAAALPGGTLNNLAQTVNNPPLNGRDAHVKTTYSMQYNLSSQYAFSNTLSGTVGYVGSVTRHLLGQTSSNIAPALAAPGTNLQKYSPFPDFSSGYFVTGAGIGAYNSLQATLEKRFGSGLYFLSSYTWSHALDDIPAPLGDGQQGGIQNILLIPLKNEYASSTFDVRHKFNFSGNYQLPFGTGKRYLNTSKLANELVGGWAVTPTLTVQTGNPFTVGPANFSGPSGAGSFALKTGDPFKGGGSPNSTNPTISCPTSVRNKTNWFNPCAFSNPKAWDQGATIITDTASALQYVGSRGDQIAGPGYYRINGSVFKSFTTFKEQYLQFRVDVFNLFNHPALGQPSGSINNTAGQITSVRTLGKDQPDSRFFQFALKYYF